MGTNSVIFMLIMSTSNILLTPTHGRRNRTFQPICLQWSRVFLQTVSEGELRVNVTV
jgi:hypothetical protein